jgi:hypothetical protein
MSGGWTAVDANTNTVTLLRLRDRSLTCALS